MSEKKAAGRKLAKAAAVTSALLCLGILTLYIIAALAIRTPFAAGHLSRLASAYLGQPVSIGGLGFTGGAIRIDNLRLLNHAGFGNDNLAIASSVAIRPAWRDLLGGRNTVSDLVVDGLRISLGKNHQGVWNFEKLVRGLSQQKGGRETFIKRLRLTRSAVRIEGIGVENIHLEVHNLSTKGTDRGRIALTGTDREGNPIRLEGAGRLGQGPSGELALSAKNLSPGQIFGSLPPGKSFDLTKARVTLLATLKFHQGNLDAAGKIDVEDAAMVLARTTVPLKGELAFNGRYEAATDEAIVDSCSLELNDLARLVVSGTVRQVKTRRAFSARLSLAPVELSSLYKLLPLELRRDVSLTGRLENTIFKVAGDAAGGITAATGTILLTGGEMHKAEQLLVQDLALKAKLTRVTGGWQAAGTIRSGGGQALLQRLNAPFSATFSPGMTPLQAAIPSLSATVFNVPATGSIAYGTGSGPLSIQLKMADVPLAALRHPALKGVAIASGRGRLALEAKGRSSADFTGTVEIAVAGFKGDKGGKAVALQSGRIGSAFSRIGGKISASGEALCRGASFDGKEAGFSVAYRIDNTDFLLTRLNAKLNGAKVTIAEVHGRLPMPARQGEVTKIPVHVGLNGLTAQKGGSALDGLAGTIAADLLSVGSKRWLIGDGELSSGQVSFEGAELGSLAVHLGFGESGIVADVEGRLLDGDGHGTIRLDPFDPTVRTAFKMTLSGLHAERIAALKPGTLPFVAKGGLLGVKLSGEYQRGQDLQCRLEADGSGLNVAGKDGRTLLRSGALRATADLARDIFNIRQLTASAGEAVTIRGSGEVAHPFSPSRRGHVSLALAETSVDAVLTAFINSLPRSVQEGTATGTIGAEGNVRIASKRILFDGSISLAKAGMEIPSQKFIASGITGTIPLSVDLLAAEQQPKRMKLSRETFQGHLATLKESAAAGPDCTIGKIRFGEMELGETTLALRAGNGMTELVSLKSTLFRGTLLGDAFFSYGRKISFGGDLIASDLSLTALCNAYPNLKGYLSGKVDGFISLSGAGAGVGGVRGFFHVWAHERPDEAMLVSKEFLQKLAGKKLRGVFFRNDRPYDRGEIRGYLEKGYLTFDTLDISNTNFFGIKDLSVTVAPVQNRIAVEHLLTSIKEAATRGKTTGAGDGAAPPVETEFKWEE